MKAIVFVLRGCPAGWLGAYGNEWVATPHLDRVAAEGVVFDRHISDRPEPTAASRAWLARPNPPAPFPQREGRAGGEVFSAPPFPSREGGPGGLGGANIRTVLVRANHPDTDAPEWFYAGWDEVFDARPQEEDRSPLDQLIRSLPPLLDRIAASDFLLWIEIDRLLPPWEVAQEVFEAYIADSDSEDGEADEQEQDEDDDEEDEDEQDEEQEPDEEDAHSPLTTHHSPPTVTPWSDPPAGPFDTSDPDALEWLHCSFAAVVTTLDAELGAIFEQLRGRQLDQSAAWVVTSDFGYPLGEHAQIGLHRPWLHHELVHLPLLLRLPAAAEAGRHVYGFTQPADLAPTLLDLFGVKQPEGLAGFSLLPLARGEAESSRPHAITALELGDAAAMAIRTDDWAFLLPVRVPEGETHEPQLFEKPDDRWEVNDLRPRNIERADELEAELRKAGALPAVD